jgi:hypothetical protein
VQAGDSIALRTQFLDDQGHVKQPSPVSIFLFEPDIDTTDLSLALVSGEPSYLGNGICEYIYTPVNDVIAGEWADRWQGTINGQVLDTTFSFTVTNSGEILDLPDQLFRNNIIEITIASGIQGIDGSVMTEPYTFTFMTETFPSYSNIRKIRLEYGGYIPNIEDDTIQLAILEASLSADDLVFSQTKNTKFLSAIKREWVTCKVALTLVHNLSHSLIKSKSLADFSVSYDTNTLRDAMAKAYSCLERWEPQLMAGGYAIDAQQARGVVKGELDPDRPKIGRTWFDAGEINSDSRLPAANTKDLATTQRRYKSMHSRRKRSW